MISLVGGLATLRAEFNVVNPNRDRRSDGWIGDARHAAGVSDHNPDPRGVVHAIDVDVDGVPMGRIVAFVVDRCRRGHETRLQYVIYNRTIWSRSWGWTARAYLGTDPHTGHGHFSSRYTDDAGSIRAWGVAAEFGPHVIEVKPVPRKPVDHAAGSRRLAQQQPPLRGADVAYVQRYIGPRQCGAADGAYGPHTAAGVKWYQQMRGIARTGAVDAQTWRNMGVRPAAGVP